MDSCFPNGKTSNPRSGHFPGATVPSSRFLHVALKGGQQAKVHQDRGRPDPGLRVAVDGRSFVLTSDRPALGVWLEAGDGTPLPENYVDVWPGRPLRIAVPPGVDSETVRVRSLHDLRPR